MTATKFRMTPSVLRDFVWRQVFSEIEAELPSAVLTLQDVFAACEATRPLMTYKTGSISVATAIALYAVVRHVRPRTVFEVGTFIGKSTLAMAKAMDANGSGGVIYTCDMSNDFHIPTSMTQVEIVGHPKTSSADALRATAKVGAKLDFMHIDGRVSLEDMETIAQIADSKMVVALDDFEGAEKGVMNSRKVKNHPFFAKHMLVYPPPDSFFREVGIISSSLTGLLVPESAFVYSNQ